MVAIEADGAIIVTATSFTITLKLVVWFEVVSP